MTVHLVFWRNLFVRGRAVIYCEVSCLWSESFVCLVNHRTIPSRSHTPPPPPSCRPWAPLHCHELVLFIYWILCCLFCTYTIPRVLFTRNLDWPKGIVTGSDRRCRGAGAEGTPAPVLWLWWRQLRDGGDFDLRLQIISTFKMFQIQINGAMGVGGLLEGALHTRLPLGVSWKLGSCTFKFVLFQPVCPYKL